MPTFGQLLGALMADITHARRISDECAVRLAEYYQSEPLLQGLPVPRVRLPEIVIEIPVLIDRYVNGSSSEVNNAADLAHHFGQAAKLVLEQQEILIDEFERKFQGSIQPRLALAISATLPGFEGVSMRARVFQAAQDAFNDVLHTHKLNVSAQVKRTIYRELKLVAEMETFESPAQDPTISLKVESTALKNHVKVQGLSSTLTNLRVVIKEEEIEWHHVDHIDGTRTSHLKPQ
ncbi:hypothetical protein AB3R30_16020 [Leptolyngbyaceae cyanobacterium UHCC 1019]